MAHGDARNHRLTVAVVGAGIAGMSAALRLLEADHDVILIERSPFVGGKFGGVLVDGIHHEHAYHFFSDWCVNFWELAKTIGLDQEKDFAVRTGIKFLRKKATARDRPGFTELQYFGSPNYFWANVYSHVARWSDIFIYFYSMIDLISDPTFEQDEHQNFLNAVSVNGFMRSRRYSTVPAALLHQEGLLKTFAVPSYETSARAYRTFLKYSLPERPSVSDDRRQAFKLLKGPSPKRFFEPFVSKLTDFNRDGERRFALLTSTSLSDIRLEPLTKAADEEIRRAGATYRVIGIEVVDRTDGRRWLPVDHVILAVPHESLSALVAKNRVLREAAPELLRLRKLRSQHMASLDLYFTRRLPNIPKEHVTLIDPRNPVEQDRVASAYGLSFIDNSQLWEDERGEDANRDEVRNTFINVASSDFEPLASLPESEAATAIISELKKYLTFEDADIDRDRSHFQAHSDAPLFTNRVGSWEFRPEIRTGEPNQTCAKIANLHLAGDYCRSPIDIVSVEGAVFTGILAAQAASDKVAPPTVPEKADGSAWQALKLDLRPWLELAVRSARAPRRS